MPTLMRSKKTPMHWLPHLVLMTSLTASCSFTPQTPTDAVKEACPTAVYPSVTAWSYRDSLPRQTPAQQQFHDWTARVLDQQTRLP